MKFGHPLREALFLKRRSVNIVEADTGGVKINLLCTNNNKLLNSTVLGSRIWYTPERFIPSYCPAIWQLSEVDFGEIVCVNENLCTDLFIEGYNNKIISFLNFDNNNNLLQPNQHLPGGYNYDFSLIDKHTNNIAGLIIVKSTTSEYFPEGEFSVNKDIREELLALIHAKMLGYRAILCCFVLAKGITELALSSKYEPECNTLLAKALDIGVEICAYATNPSASSIEVTAPVKLACKLN